MPHKKKQFKLSKEKQEALNNYLEYKKISCKSKSKMHNYKYFISCFLEFSKKSLKDYEESQIIDYLNHSSKNYSVGSMNEIKWMLKSFICWFYEDYSKKFRNLNRILLLQKKEKTYSPEQMLRKEQIEKLVQEEPELRWKAFLLLYFYGGFRPIEVCQLKWKDITFDKEGCYVKVISNKNRKEFQKYIPEDVCFYLRKLQERSHDSEYIFPTKRKFWNTTKKDKEKISVGDKPMTRSGVYQHLVPLAKRVLDRHVNPYILRHSIATILYNRDDLKDDDVAQQLGHSKAMKETYNNLSLDKIRARMKKIWINPENLPPEKKEEMEALIEKQQQEIYKNARETNFLLKENLSLKKLMEEIITELNKIRNQTNELLKKSD